MQNAEIVVAVVVFAAVAAFCVATFGTGAIALVAAGAIAGAVAAVAGKFTGESVKSLMTWSNQFSGWRDYAKSAFVGFAAGGLAGGLGAAFPNMAKTLSLGLNSFGISFFDQLGDIWIKGEGKPFHSPFVWFLLKCDSICKQLICCLVNIITVEGDVTKTIFLFISRVIRKLRIILRPVVVGQFESYAVVSPKKVVRFLRSWC